jgi:S-adenosylhomocysteine hydrolase
MKTKDTNNMSTTPRTDAARGFHDMDTAVSAEDMAKLETELAVANKRIADCEARAVANTVAAIIEKNAALRYAKNAEYWQSCAEKAEARLDFLIVHGGDYVGYAETWNVSIEDLDRDMAAKSNFNK